MSSQMFWLLSYVSLGLALSLGNRATSIHGSSSSSSSSSSASSSSSTSSSSSSSSASSQQQQQQNKQQAATSGLRTHQDGRFTKNEAHLRPAFGPISSPLIFELGNLSPYRYERAHLDEQATNFRRSLDEDDEDDDDDDDDDDEEKNNDYYYRYNNINMNNNKNKNTNKNNRNSKEERGRAGSNTRESAFLDEFAMAVLDSLDPRDRQLLVSGRTLPNPRDEAPRRLADVYRTRRPPLRSRNALAINSIRSSNDDNDVARKTSRSQPIQLYDRVRTLEATNRRDEPHLLPQHKYSSSDWSNDENTRMPNERGKTKNRRDNEDDEQDRWILADKTAIKRNDGSRARIPPSPRNAAQWTGSGQPQSPNPPGGGSIASQFLLRSARGNRQYDVPQIECPASEDGMERFACPTPDRMGRYRCIDDHVLCDGFIDCPTAEDEDRQACMFYKTTKAHLDVLADALLRWARGR